MNETLNLPKPHSTNIIKKMNKFSVYNEILAWKGDKNIVKLFFSYLYHKYKSKCFVSETIFNVIDKDDDDSSKIKSINQICYCIKQNDSPIIIIPIKLILQEGGHSNLLIYRKKFKTIERFEPHGSQLFNQDAQLVATKYNEFVNDLNVKLKKSNLKPLIFLDAHIACPRNFGLQVEENIKKEKKEGGGYCAVWSMFFAELILMNPNKSSHFIYTNIFNYLNTLSNKEKYLIDVIRGYVHCVKKIFNRKTLGIFDFEFTYDQYIELFHKEKKDKTKNDFKIIQTIDYYIDAFEFIDNEFINNNKKFNKENMLEMSQKMERAASNFPEILYLEKQKQHILNNFEIVNQATPPSVISNQSNSISNFSPKSHISISSTSLTISPKNKEKTNQRKNKTKKKQNKDVQNEKKIVFKKKSEETKKNNNNNNNNNIIKVVKKPTFIKHKIEKHKIEKHKIEKPIEKHKIEKPIEKHKIEKPIEKHKIEKHKIEKHKIEKHKIEKPIEKHEIKKHEIKNTNSITNTKNSNTQKIIKFKPKSNSDSNEFRVKQIPKYFYNSIRNTLTNVSELIKNKTKKWFKLL
jgi:hypothetical protein